MGHSICFLCGIPALICKGHLETQPVKKPSRCISAGVFWFLNTVGEDRPIRPDSTPFVTTAAWRISDLPGLLIKNTKSLGAYLLDQMTSPFLKTFSWPGLKLFHFSPVVKGRVAMTYPR